MTKKKPLNKDIRDLMMISAMLLSGCAIVALLFFVIPEDKESTYAFTICARVYARYEQACESKDLLENHRDAVLACMPDDISDLLDTLDRQILCLENEGVDLIREITP